LAEAAVERASGEEGEAPFSEAEVWVDCQEAGVGEGGQRGVEPW